MRERALLAGLLLVAATVAFLFLYIARGTQKYIAPIASREYSIIEGLETGAVESRPASRPARPSEDPAASQPAGLEGEPEDPVPSASRPAGPVGWVQGRVTDERGSPIRFARVVLAVERREVDDEGEETSVAYEKVTDGRANASGVFRLQTRMGGELCLIASTAGFEEAKVRRTFLDPPFQDRVDLTLGTRHVSRLRGRLLDTEGAALRPVNLLFLFPEAVRGGGSQRVRDFWGASGIYAAAESFCPGAWRGGIEGEQASVDLETAHFEVEVPAGAERIVTVVFRDQPIADRRWKDGDPDLEFRLDVPALNRTLGNLELDVLDAASLAPVAGAEVSLRKLVGDFGMRALHTTAGQPSLVARGLPAGPYAAEVASPEHATASAKVEIPPFGTARAVVELARRANVRLNLLPVEGWLPDRASFKLEYRNAAGLRLPCAALLEESGEVVRLGDAPPGPGFVVLAGNVIRVELASGENADRGLPVRRPRKVKLRFRPRADLLGPLRSVVCEARLIGPGGIPVAESVQRVSRRADGRCLVALDAPPGAYTLELAACRGRLVRRAVQVGEEPVTEILLESP